MDILFVDHLVDTHIVGELILRRGIELGRNQGSLLPPALRRARTAATNGWSLLLRACSSLEGTGRYPYNPKFLLGK